jgi:subtilisin family serine protease
MKEWLVVRRRRPVRSDALELPEPIARSSGTRSSSDDGPKVGIERADSQDALSNRDEIDTAGSPMPMSLIEPIACSPAATQEILSKAKETGTTWGLRALGVDPTKFGGTGVSVAIIDTGIEHSHPAFAHLPDEAIEEADFTERPSGVFGRGAAADAAGGHGTHCAATICGDVVDGIRIGVAPKIKKLLVAKAIGGCRGSAALLDALNWAVTNRADVISMSLGFDFVGYRNSLTARQVHDDAATSMALTAFRDNIRVFDAWMVELRARRAQGYDPLIIAASGNQSHRPTFVIEKTSPSEADSIVSVGAIDEDMAIAPFSNVNPTFVCPGVGVLSAGISERLAVKSGTSMACPHLAGLAALYWQAARLSGPRATANRVLRMMENSAEQNFGPFETHVITDIGNGMPLAPALVRAQRALPNKNRNE